MNTYDNEDPLLHEMRATDWGKFLLSAGFEPYHTESAARRVAEHAVERIAELERQRDELLEALGELSSLCERAWDGMVIGRPIRNQAKQVIAKAKGVTP